ncbi:MULTISPECIES: DNA-3-methyladenine glycosylase [unclassified Methanoregula]|uniref:DNA-3-methyladenine glycosylase family protein n=1 Tax=unclassified Methanoregula TaxID=2649730 RepID=UPI0009CC9CA9|nr:MULTISPECIES: DNA glycosylase [unclassified Methanoregula]OPX61961.1 MAG: Endonuclease III [Methanoregula sp. PtaB.Bin085]OPY34364.1 MAG: Endonuclease III [Methanoregula sp. PtaU1.Bin006]
MPCLTLRHDQPFSLDATLSCGQVFRWNRMDDSWWYGVVGDRVIRIRQDGNRLTYEGAPASFIVHYFSLDTDLVAILNSIDTDPFIHACIEKNRGLRLVRQPPWECTISYICSTNSNIPTIRRRIASIAEKFGKRIEFRGRVYHTFPEPSSIICEGHSGLTECRLGYRQSYVFGTSSSVTNAKDWANAISRLPYADARKELMTLEGVGPKAADCILLFAFQKYEAFPVDVWIRRIMAEHYLPELSADTPLTNRDYDTIHRFARRHFGNYCGWAQEYLYAGRVR